jgi:hypothetical protein
MTQRSRALFLVRKSLRTAFCGVGLAALVAAFTVACSDQLEDAALAGARASDAAAPSAKASDSSHSDPWRPRPGATWQWQLADEPLDLSLNVEMYDLDLFETTAAVVRQVHDRGAKAVCYLSAGTREDWRPDAAQFPREVVGKPYAEWPGERWLDIRRLDLLASIMQGRLDLCAAKGFDGVEPDNIDGFTNDTGFPLTMEDQLRYNLWLAQEAHKRGLSIGLKNSPELAGQLVGAFDWALTEDCVAEGWCAQLAPFFAQGKAVFSAEYTDTRVTLEAACAQARALGLSVILKRRELDAYRQAC